MGPREPLEVIPPPLARAVADLPYWFVIGGQAMRCLCPYRPSRDVDFGVTRQRAEQQGLVDVVAIDLSHGGEALGDSQ